MNVAPVIKQSSKVKDQSWDDLPPPPCPAVPPTPFVHVSSLAIGKNNFCKAYSITQLFIAVTLFIGIVLFHLFRLLSF